MSHICIEQNSIKDFNMVQKYFDAANDLMELSNLCADEEAINILKNGYLKIIELAESHGAIIKRAEDDTKAAE